MLRSYPFLKYAVNKIFWHSDEAQRLGIDQTEFLRNFGLARWIQVRNKVELYPVRRYRPDMALLYILAESDVGNLIRLPPGDGSYAKPGRARYGPPIFVALATRSENALRALVKSEADNHQNFGFILDFEAIVNKICEAYPRRSEDSSTFHRDFKFWDCDTTLDYKANKLNIDLVSQLDTVRDSALCLFLLNYKRSTAPSWLTASAYEGWFRSRSLQPIIAYKDFLEFIPNMKTRAQVASGMFNHASGSNPQNIELIDALMSLDYFDVNVPDHARTTPLQTATRRGPDQAFDDMLIQGNILP